MINPAPLTGLVDLARPPLLDVGGPTVQHLVGDGDDQPHVLRGVVRDDIVIPLHSHPDPETFTVLSGSLEGLVVTPSGQPEWTRVRAGEVFHVPGGLPHAWRHRDDADGVALITTTATLSRFFAELGRPVERVSDTGWPPSRETLTRLLETSARYGYWAATPEENARVGIVLPS